MSKNAEFVSHKKSKLKVNGKPQLPAANALTEGEIAINFAKGVETLSIKNESGDVVTFSSDNYYTEQKLGSGFTGANSAVTVTEAIENIPGVVVDQVIDSGTSASTNAVATKAVYDAIHDNESVVEQALNDLETNKLDASAFTTYSGTVDTAIGSKASQSDLNTLSGTVTAHTASTVHMTTTEKTNLDSLATNIASISGITSTKVSNWDTAATNNHTHSNKSTLDAITATSTAINSLTGSVGTMAFQNTSSYSSATQVNTALSGKSNTGHTHDDRYYTESELTGSSTTVVVAKAASATTAASANSVALSNVSGADDIKAIEALTGTSGILKKTAANTWALDTTSYSSATQVNTALGGKSDTGHTHDDRYYTESELTGSSTTVVVAKAASATTAANAASASSVALSNVSGADDLKAIEALTGTSGILKKTAANTWALDTNSYSTTAVAVTGATYNTTDKTIDLKNAAGTVVSTVDATAFIKDGMVSNVEVKNVASSGTCLVITFNTDAGKDAINIPIAQIFDASNYYTKNDLTGSSTTVVVAKAASATTAASAGSVALSNVSGADDLKAIEALTGTSGLLKKTAANTWALDTTSYSSATQVNTALSGKSNTGHTHDDRYYTESELTGSSTSVVVAKAASATTAASANSVALSNVSGADDLKAIEALTGTSGLLKKTAANTWSLDTTSYSSATQVNTALSSKADKTEDLDGVKIKKITQSAYDALVQAGTVDPNTLYFITD